jgi:hypothetical protein
MSSVWIVLVGGRLNSIWHSEARAEAHLKQLFEVNGDQLAAHVQEIEVRE